MSEPEPGPLDEAAHRTPGYRGGVAVTFADGTVLNVPLPRARYVPGDDDDAPLEDWDLGLEYANLRAVVLGAATLTESLRAEFRLCRWLLALNYALDPADVRRLLVFGVEGQSDPDHVRLREELVGIALGRTPAEKPSGGG